MFFFFILAEEEQKHGKIRRLSRVSSHVTSLESDAKSRKFKDLKLSRPKLMKDST